MNAPTEHSYTGDTRVVRKSLAIRAACAGLLVALSTSVLSAQSADDAVREYQATLERVGDLRLDILRKRYFLEQQKAEVASLNSEISDIPALTDGFDEILDKMAAQMEDAITADLPFQREERLNRIAKLKEDLAKTDMSAGAKYRQALNAYKIEIGYGSSVEGYEGERPLNEGEEPVIVVQLDKKGENRKEADGSDMMGPQLGTYLRYGRVALVYMNQRATEARRYDVESGKWLDVTGAELLNVRKAIRMSNGEIAPAVVMAPAYITQ